ncbi:MAG: efflux RND transporter periplasmic adaptor subunit [Opitutales bacterium]
MASVEEVANFGEILEALGTTLANEAVTLTANATDLVESIHFEDGQSVQRGDVLVLLEKKEEEAALKAARATMDERKRAFERAKELVEQQAVSTATVEERRALLQEAEGRVEEIEARIRDRIVRAPFDGILGLRQISPGTLLRPGDVITTIDDLSQIKVDFDAPSLFLASLHPGQQVQGRVAAFGDEVFAGTVATVRSRVDPITRTVTVRAILPNPDLRLRPGLLMSLRLNKNARESRLIPEGAVIQRGERSFVFAVDEAAGGEPPRARNREVKLGTRIPGKVEVREGLQAGERVIIHGLMQVRDGQTLKILGESTGVEPLISFLEDVVPVGATKAEGTAQ